MFYPDSRGENEPKSLRLTPGGPFLGGPQQAGEEVPKHGWSKRINKKTSCRNYHGNSWCNYLSRHVEVVNSYLWVGFWMKGVFLSQMGELLDHSLRYHVLYGFIGNVLASDVATEKWKSRDDEYVSIIFLTCMERQRDQSNPWEITFGRYDHVTSSYMYIYTHTILYTASYLCNVLKCRFWKHLKHVLQFLFVLIVVVIVLLHYRTVRE